MEKELSELPEAAAKPTDMRTQPASLGYAINLMMDYGSGRQVTISCTLPVDAELPDMHKKLDMLRLATNRQAALVALRDVETSVTMARKTKESLELMIPAYEKEMNEEIARLERGPTATHSVKKQQVENMRAQTLNNRLTKKEEIMRAQADIEKGEAVIAMYKREIAGEG